MVEGQIVTDDIQPWEGSTNPFGVVTKVGKEGEPLEVKTKGKVRWSYLRLGSSIGEQGEILPQYLNKTNVSDITENTELIVIDDFVTYKTNIGEL